MKGFDVLFPQGWDCHGLPTEVKVEETHNIRKNDVPRDEFREMCIELTHDNIEKMRTQMQSLGFSQDWSREFVTMTRKKETKIVILGSYNSGKTTTLENLCDKKTKIEYNGTTIALDYGNIKIDGEKVHIFGSPGQERFEFMASMDLRAKYGLK